MEIRKRFSNYVHGTHVAGILMSGNPYAQLIVGRATSTGVVEDFCPSGEYFERDARAVQQFVDFFKSQGARVVNMSWGGNPRGLEARLQRCNVASPGEERRQLARQWFEVWRKALEDAVRSAPQIVFITTAGEKDGAPGGLPLPNLMTVGSVDFAGDMPSDSGPTAELFALGEDVESDIPGGFRLRMSGSSMAAPAVANLAAKIMSVNPKATPAAVIALIRRTSEPSDGGRKLIHPKNALAAALSQEQR